MVLNLSGEKSGASALPRILLSLTEPSFLSMGHPVMGHPVQDILDPTDVSKVKTRINCMTCHTPHSSAEKGLLVKDQANNTAFCDNCHKDRMNMRNTVTP